MKKTEDQATGQKMLEELALRHAGQYGLWPEKIEWHDLGYECLRKILTAEHRVRMVFSPNEIEEYAAEGSVAKDAKIKIRNAFASLTM